MEDQDENVEEEELSDDSEEQSSETRDSDDERTSNTPDEDLRMDDANREISMQPNESGTLSSPRFDLEVIKTFHHFLATTSHTLPTPHFEAQAECYWQTIVLPLALSRHWLMSGLLAISEYHASVLTHDEADAKACHQRALSFFANFVSGREEASRHVCGAVLTPEKEEERRVGGQLMCILRCAHWALTPDPMLGQSFTSYPFKLQNFVTALRSFSLLERTEQGSGAEAVSPRTSQTFDAEDTYMQDEQAVALLRRLDALPSLISEVFSRPDSVRDVTTIRAAITSLTEHFSSIFEARSAKLLPTAVWYSMVSELLINDL